MAQVGEEFPLQCPACGGDIRLIALHQSRILMTSLAFILGVVPLVLGTGAGAEMRQALGTAVFSGMLGVTVFGIFFTPVFYAVLTRFARRPAA